MILCRVATLVPVAATAAILFSFSSLSSHYIYEDRMNIFGGEEGGVDRE